MGTNRYESIGESFYLESRQGSCRWSQWNAVIVNRAIDELTKEITEHYNHIKKSLGFVTAELVKNAVKGIGQKPVTLLVLFREHNEEFKKRIGVDRIKETYDSYQRSYKHLSFKKRKVLKI